MHVYSRINKHSRTHREFWTLLESNVSVVKAEWNELWMLFSQIGLVKPLHVTIFHERSMIDGINVFPAEDLLPALQGVREMNFSWKLGESGKD